MVSGQSYLVEHWMSYQPVDIGPDCESPSGIKWPQVFRHGSIVTAILESDDDKDAIMEKGWLMSAVLLSDPPTILYSEKVDKRRRDNDICHELAHMIATDVLGLEYEMTEADTQGMGNFLHQLIEQVLEEHGVNVYESAMETKRTTSMCEVASRRRDMAEALAASDLDGSCGSPWPTGGSDSCGRPDEEPCGRSEVVSTSRRKPRPPSDEGCPAEAFD